MLKLGLKQVEANPQATLPMRRLLLVPAALTIVTAVLAWRIRALSGLDSHRFLLWNLFLAWIPLVASAGLYRLRRGTAPLLSLLGTFWLVFLPNAPYVVTDLIHYGQLNQRIPSWLDLLTLLSAALAGLSLALLSLRYAHLALSARLGRWSSLPVAAAILASSVGVYLGRILRLNSWDVARPHRVASLLLPRLEAPQEHPLMLGGIALCSLCLGLAYLAVYRLSRD